MEIRRNNLSRERQPLYRSIDFDVAIDTYHFKSSSGKTYADLRSGLWNLGLGYQSRLNAQLAKMLKEQLAIGGFYQDNFSFEHPIHQKIAWQLAQLLPSSLTNVQFVNSGSEGIELALKLATSWSRGRQFKIASFKGSYHGNFLGGLSISGMDSLEASRSEMAYKDTVYLTFPRDASDEEDLLAQFEELAKTLTALVIEPVLASSGVLVASDAFMSRLIAIARANRVLVIMDEVATGFFRTGPCFYHERLIYQPDVVVLSKQINNGYLPFGAVVWTDQVDQSLQRYPIEHFSTQNGNTLCALSANLTLDYYIEHGESLKLQASKTEQLMQGLASDKGLNFRQKGTMQSIIMADQAVSMALLNQLADYGILVYAFENDQDAGISLLPCLTSAQNPNFEKELKLVYQLASRHV